MSKKIGFRSYQNDEEPDKQDELEKQQAERQKSHSKTSSARTIHPIGTTSQKCYKTTAELVYELSNIVDVAPMALAKQLADAGYHVEYLAGQPYSGDVRVEHKFVRLHLICTNLYKSVQPHLFDNKHYESSARLYGFWPLL